jgi:DNA-binding transcriptional LysR family regulator
MAQLENSRHKVFRAVAEHLSFREAAERLFLTQPAVTLQIKALENDLSVRLFDRSTGRISLTRHGELLLRYANKIASLVSDAEHELGAGDGHSGNTAEIVQLLLDGKVSIGLIEGPARVRGVRTEPS